jgi:hypothetical protein
MAFLDLSGSTSQFVSSVRPTLGSAKRRNREIINHCKISSVFVVRFSCLVSQLSASFTAVHEVPRAHLDWIFGFFAH